MDRGCRARPCWHRHQDRASTDVRRGCSRRRLTHAPPSAPRGQASASPADVAGPRVRVLPGIGGVRTADVDQLVARPARARHGSRGSRRGPAPADRHSDHQPRAHRGRPLPPADARRAVVGGAVCSGPGPERRGHVPHRPGTHPARPVGAGRSNASRAVRPPGRHAGRGRLPRTHRPLAEHRPVRVRVHPDDTSAAAGRHWRMRTRVLIVDDHPGFRGVSRVDQDRLSRRQRRRRRWQPRQGSRRTPPRLLARARVLGGDGAPCRMQGGA
jgi:hypothetical protein